jgi:MFS family permease
LVGPVRFSADEWRVIAAQAARAAGYGLTAVLLGGLLAQRHASPVQVGLVLSALVAGAAGGSLLFGRFGDAWGRRRCYAAIYVGIAAAGSIAATGPPLWLLGLVALTGTLSTDVVDNGPATTLEQTMLANRAQDHNAAHVFGVYNALASTAGALGALAAGVPALAGPQGHLRTATFVILAPIGLVGVLLAARLTPAVEAAAIDSGHHLRQHRSLSRLGDRSKPTVHRLAALFAVDAAGGGLVTASFLSYYLITRYHASTAVVGTLFFAATMTQAVSVLLAPRLADRFGLIPTMVGTHLPSNVLLIAMAFAPNLPIAGAIFLAHKSVSQMDVPTRQALVMIVVSPAERTPAAAITNAARYSVRPSGPLIAAVLQHAALAAPLLAAGTVKAGYDITLWRWARRHGIGQRTAIATRP